MYPMAYEQLRRGRLLKESITKSSFGDFEDRPSPYTDIVSLGGDTPGELDFMLLLVHIGLVCTQLVDQHMIGQTSLLSQKVP
jgi:hypothetical protein